MPVTVGMDFVRLEQDDFARLVFGVMREVFSLHEEMGRLFDEKVYQSALAGRIEELQTEVRMDVKFRDFSKSYFIDAVVSRGGVFELKAVDKLSAKHRSQLLNYLLLAGVSHGKLVKFRTERVEHEFVNTTLTHAERTQFAVDDSAWLPTAGFESAEKALVVEMLRDWGTGLERGLYDECLTHHLTCSEHMPGEVDVRLAGAPVARQPVTLCHHG